MNFLKKIFRGEIDDTVHSQFVRFSVGSYDERAQLKIKAGSNIQAWASFEYVNDFILFIAENAKADLVVKGKVFSKERFEHEACQSYAKKKGFTVAEVDQTMSPEELKDLHAQLHSQYLLLDVSSGSATLKSKKAPHNPRGKFDPKFCTMKVDSSLPFIEEFAWDAGKFKEAQISHSFIIEDVIVDEKLLEEDPARARVEAKRRGKVVRIISADGEKKKQEADFTA